MFKFFNFLKKNCRQQNKLSVKLNYKFYKLCWYLYCCESSESLMMASRFVLGFWFIVVFLLMVTLQLEKKKFPEDDDVTLVPVKLFQSMPKEKFDCWFKLDFEVDVFTIDSTRHAIHLFLVSRVVRIKTLFTGVSCDVFNFALGKSRHFAHSCLSCWMISNFLLGHIVARGERFFIFFNILLIVWTPIFIFLYHTPDFGWSITPRYNGPVSCKWAGLLLLYAMNIFMGHRSPPVSYIFGWIFLGWKFNPALRVFVRPSM